MTRLSGWGIGLGVRGETMVLGEWTTSTYSYHIQLGHERSGIGDGGGGGGEMVAVGGETEGNVGESKDELELLVDLKKAGLQRSLKCSDSIGEFKLVVDYYENPPLENFFTRVFASLDYVPPLGLCPFIFSIIFKKNLLTLIFTADLLYCSL